MQAVCFSVSDQIFLSYWKWFLQILSEGTQEHKNKTLLPLIELILFHSELLLALTTHEMFFHCLNLQRNKTKWLSLVTFKFHTIQIIIIIDVSYRSTKWNDFYNFLIKLHKLFIFCNELSNISHLNSAVQIYDIFMYLYVLNIHYHYSPWKFKISNSSSLGSPSFVYNVMLNHIHENQSIKCRSLAFILFLQIFENDQGLILRKNYMQRFILHLKSLVKLPYPKYHICNLLISKETQDTVWGH